MTSPYDEGDTTELAYDKGNSHTNTQGEDDNKAQDRVLTQTGYPGFLCSKDVWVILNLSVSILVPLWE